jgi:hypothetical protein
MKVYVIPLTHLRNVSSVYLPVEGKYAMDSSKKAKKDWTRYEEAWHLLGGLKLRTNSNSPSTKPPTVNLRGPERRKSYG